VIDWVVHRWRQAWHEAACRPVLSTPPVMPRDDGVIVFSMIGTRVLLSYLVAIKSLMASLGRGRVALLDDGTLTAVDKVVIAAHLGDPVIYDIATVDTDACPRGGCWERLMVLLGLADDAYVIQLDSDTVTLGDVREVRDAIEAGRAFTLLGGIDGEALGRLTLAQFRQHAHPDGPAPEGQHVQDQIESRLDLLPDAGHRRYVRGCAGFAGFPKGSVSAVDAAAFSQAAAALVGAQAWQRWGSEQVASNYLIANTSDPVLLPYDRYYNYWDDERPDAAFAHFVGMRRYSGKAYSRATRAAIARLS